MLKRMLSTVILFNSFAFSDALEELSLDSNVRYFEFNSRKVVYDNTCDKVDNQKLLILMSAIAEEKKENPYYLDVCKPFKEIYTLKKEPINENTSAKYNKLMQQHYGSFYINFFSFLYSKNLPNSTNFKIFKHNQDEMSHYINFYHDRPYSDPVRKIQVNFSEYLYNSKELDFFMKTEMPFLFNAVEEDVLKGLRREGKEKELISFLKRVIKNKDGRNLKTDVENLEIANTLFKLDFYNIENYNREEILKFLLKSYKIEKHLDQVDLLNRILIKDRYIYLLDKYPESLSNLKEYNFIQEELKKNKDLSKDINGKYYYKLKLDVFLYKKLLYIDNTSVNKGLAEKAIRFLINAEKSKAVKDSLSLDIYNIKNDNFIEKKEPHLLN